MPSIGATWTEAITAVAEATGTPYAFAIDNKGHRFASAGFALGIELFDADGNFDLEDDPGYRAFAEWMKAWFDNGLTPAEVWLGGGQYSSARDYFVNAEVVMPLFRQLADQGFRQRDWRCFRLGVGA